MEDIRELLRAADPLQREPTLTPRERNFRREAVLAAASAAREPAGERPRSRIAALAVVGSMAILASYLGLHSRSPFVSDLQAAVSFEVRLAEDKPANGLSEVKLPGSERPVYVHHEVIVTSSDIAAARVVQGAGPAQYGVSVTFTPSGAEKMRAATANHIGRPMVILIDGQAVTVAVVRTPISESAVVSGNYTRAQAERIAKGVQVQ